MAFEEAIRSITMVADSSLAVATGVAGAPGSPTDNSGYQYRFVKVTGSRTVGLADGDDTDTVIGVLQNKPQVTGEAATVAIRGVSKVRCAAAVTAAAPVYSSANGRATGTAGSSAKFGIAITTTANADELLSVLLRIN